MAAYRTIGGHLTTTYSPLYTCPAGKTAVLSLCRVTNTTATSAAAYISITDSSASDTYLLANATLVPATSTLRAFEDKLFLEAGDSINMRSGTAAALDAVISIMEV